MGQFQPNASNSMQQLSYGKAIISHTPSNEESQLIEYDIEITTASTNNLNLNFEYSHFIQAYVNARAIR